MDTTRRAGTKGFGALMIAHLKANGTANTVDLATAASVTPKQAYSRLMFLERTEGLLASSGRGEAKTWKLADGTAPLPVVAAVQNPSAHRQSVRPAGTINEHFNGSKGWKPSLSSGVPLERDPQPKDLVLVEYPERWRHSVLAQVTRSPDDKGACQCWDVRDKHYVYVPLTQEAMAKHGVKAALLTEKQAHALENAK